MPKIIGGTAASSMPVSDWKQTNPNRADYIKNKPEVANAIKCSASGNPILLDDISPLEHEMKVSVIGERIAPGEFGMTDITEEGYYTVSGYRSAPELNGGLECIEISFFGGKFYVLPLDYFDITYEEYLAESKIKVGDVLFAEWYSEEVDGDMWEWFDMYSVPTVKKYGINLLPNKYDSFVNGKTDKITQYGVTYTCNADGSITLNGTCESANGIVLNKTFPFANDATYCISGGETSKGASIYVSYKNESGTTVYAYTGKTISWKEGCSLVGNGVYIQASSGSVFDNYVIKPQIEVGATKTEYQQYKEPITYTADENGNVKGIIGKGEDMTLLTDVGATITAEYNADTKKYIDKKFAELQALVLEV